MVNRRICIGQLQHIAEKLAEFGERCQKEHGCSDVDIQGCPIALLLEQIGILMEAYSTCDTFKENEARIRETAKQFNYNEPSQHSNQQYYNEERYDTSNIRELSDDELMEQIVNDEMMAYYQNAYNEGIIEKPKKPKEKLPKASEFIEF